MESSQNFPMMGKVEVDETYLGGQDNKALGRNEGNKKIMVVGIERGLGGVSRWYGRVIETASKINLGEFVTDHIDKDAQVKTDCWNGYKGI
ncbi:ISXO2-like transposase domain-containing protein [Cyclobacterium lianum]|uniref:ISXO2-like transposase domain-containing protein n=2 Tax=Cyclobacterium lianum TaxID=388280 RepID=A0A1M7QUU9_9BACT|nr:ISXO2-like transposase domain-containing protein [Cyclobacterium lianum]